MEQIDEYGRHGELVARYTKGRLLGKGGFAKCYEATNVETQEKFAVKVVCKSSLKTKTRQKLKTEIKIHRSLSHRHIVKFHRYFEDSRNVYILLELCRGQTLMEQSTRKGRFTEEETAYVVYQSLLSLEHMHAEGVIHRDLKLSNIMLTADNEIKIGDFGLAAKVSSGEKRRTLCGTPNYIAPEILESGHTHSFEVDVWTVGIIMYAMLCGKPPFQTHDVKMTYGKIKRCSYTFPSNVAISSEARSLIQRILQVSPGLRPTVREMMADPWFRLHKPGKLAPLSLFVPGSAAHHSQHLRLVEERRNAAAAAAAAGADGAEPAAAAPAAAEGRGRDFKPRREPLGTVDGNREHLRAGSSSKRAFDVYCEPAAVYRRADSARGQRTASSASASASASAAAAHHHQQRAEQRDAGTGGAGFFRSASAVCKPVSASKAAPLAPSASSPLRLYNSSPRNSREIGAASPQARAAAAMAAAASAAAASSSSGGRADMSPAHERLHNTKRSPSEPASHRDVRGLRTGSVPASRSGSRDRVVDRHSSPRPRGVRSRLSSTGSAPSAAVPLRSQSQSPSPSAAAASAAAEQHQQQPRASASPRPASQPTAAAPAPAPAPSLAPAAPAEDEDLTRLHHKLEETLALVGDDADAKADNAPPAHLAPAIWVTECTDFTANYGLAYRLSNGQIGVHFNDNSKMTYDTATGDIWYVERLRGAQQQQARSSGSSGSREALSKHHVESYPDTLNKKVTLVKYFSTYILRFAGRTPKPGQQEVVTCSTAPREGFASVANPPEGTEAEEASGAGLVYVRKWLKTADATIFRLSNRTVQVAFHDKTEVILSSEAKLVTYTDKKGERTTFSLSSMTYTQPDIANRLRHTKDIIGQLIHVNGRA